MEIQTEKYGVAGLPKFGTPSNVTISSNPAVIGEVDGAFNNVITLVKKNAKPGNNIGLWFFGMTARTLHTLALALITEGPTHNA